MDAPSEYRHQGGGKETGTSGLRTSERNGSLRSSLPAQLQQLSDTAHRPVKRGLLGIPSKLSSKHSLEPDYPFAGLVESAAPAAKHRVSSALPRPLRRLGLWLGLVDSENSDRVRDRKSTRLNSSHVAISYAVFCLKKKRVQHAQA